jgi:malonyl-CoA/methylmalonyl-CoA synthetase
VRVVSPETGRELARDEIGVLEVRGANVFSGYWRSPEKTAEDLRPDGFFVTGDLSKIDGDGYVHIVGRAKDLIISGGLNVYPKEVEEVIDALPEVAESAVFGVPHPDFGEAVVAAVVPRPDVAIEEADLVASLEGRLARYKQPKRVFVVDRLPRNTMAKVQKNVLRDEFGAVFS